MEKLRKEPSEAQKRARVLNYTIFRLKGIQAHLSSIDKVLRTINLNSYERIYCDIDDVYEEVATFLSSIQALNKKEKL